MNTILKSNSKVIQSNFEKVIDTVTFDVSELNDLKKKKKL